MTEEFAKLVLDHLRYDDGLERSLARLKRIERMLMRARQVA